MNPEKSCPERLNIYINPAKDARQVHQAQITITDDGTVKIEVASNETEEEYYEEVF
jgi:hypothetical protein